MEGFHKRYRLVLDFEVSVDPDQITVYEDTDEEEQLKARSQQQLLQVLLTEKLPILEELARRKVLEEVRLFV